MMIHNIKSIPKSFFFSRKQFPVALVLFNGLFIHLVGCNTYHTYQVNEQINEQPSIVHESTDGAIFRDDDQYCNMSQDKFPIILTWLPSHYGKTLPGLDHDDELLAPYDYMNIILQHKQKGEPRKIFLFINGPGFKPDQIYELKKAAETVQGIEIVDIHDSKFNAYWEEIDEGWKIDGKSIKIKEYFNHFMYSRSEDDQMFFPVQIDTFRYIAAYVLLRYQEDQGKSIGLVYTDFDTLREVSDISSRLSKGREFQGIGKNITMPSGMVVGTILDSDKRGDIETSILNNDLFGINKHPILKKIFNDYKYHIKSQKEVKNSLGLSSIEEVYKQPYYVLNEYSFAQKKFCAVARDLVYYSSPNTISFDKNGGIRYAYHNSPSDQLWRASNDGGHNSIVRAIRTGTLVLINSLEENTEVTKDHLNAAAESENLDIVKYLIEKKGISVSGKDGQYLILCAAESGNLNVVKYLIEEQGVNVSGKDGQYLILCAPESGNLNLLKYLIEEQGINVSGEYGQYLIRCAAESGNLDIVKYLIEEQGVNVSGEDGQYLIRCAAKHEKLSVVKYLIEEKKVNFSDEDEEKECLMRYDHIVYGKSDAYHASLKELGFDID